MTAVSYPFASSSTRSMIAYALSLLNIGHTYLDLSEAGGRRAVGHPAQLLRLALAAVVRAEHLPVLLAGHPVAGIPELGGDAGIDGVLIDFSGQPAALDFTGNLAGK